MTTLSEKRAEWLYAHFQGVSRVSERLLVLFGTFLVTSTAVWRSMTPSIELPLLKVDVGREVLFGWLLVCAFFVLIAFFGNYDHGEVTLDALASELKVGYEDLWFIDTYPTVIEFARYRRPATAATRRWVGRAIAGLLYPIVLIASLFWLSSVATYELFMEPMSPFDVLPLILAAPLAYVVWDRAVEYFRRRWNTWRAVESAISAAPAV